MTWMSRIFIRVTKASTPIKDSLILLLIRAVASFKERPLIKILPISSIFIDPSRWIFNLDIEDSWPISWSCSWSPKSKKYESSKLGSFIGIIVVCIKEKTLAPNLLEFTLGFCTKVEDLLYWGASEIFFSSERLIKSDLTSLGRLARKAWSKSWAKPKTGKREKNNNDL